VGSLLGRINRISLFLVLIVVATIVTGMLVPGRTGTVIQVVGWVALAVGIIFEVGLRTTPLGNYDGNDRQPR
jgi:hypothetical protein